MRTGLRRSNESKDDQRAPGNFCRNGKCVALRGAARCEGLHGAAGCAGLKGLKGLLPVSLCPVLDAAEFGYFTRQLSQSAPLSDLRGSFSRFFSVRNPLRRRVAPGRVPLDLLRRIQCTDRGSGSSQQCFLVFFFFQKKKRKTN